MPELPEVETTRRGILPATKGRSVSAVVLRERRLRWPIDPALPSLITGRLLEAAVTADVEAPSITIEAVKEGKKKRTAGEPPVTIRLSDVVKAVVQTGL